MTNAVNQIINGECSPAFEGVRKAFTANFSERGDIGASLSIVQDGQRVVDLWGGSTALDGATAWGPDTLVNVWSTTKGVVATCFAMLVDRGKLKYSDRVSDHWPEFAAAGKERVTVAMLLSHQAGLCGFRDAATVSDFYDVDSAAARLAAASPLWEPGSRSGYHAITVGFLASALLKRVDDRSMKRFVQDEFNAEHGLDIHIGLPPEHRHRVATMLAPQGLSPLGSDVELNASQLAALANPPLDPLLPNSSQWRGAEIPSANGFATARALASLYGALASDGSLNGKTLLNANARNEATQCNISGRDEVLSLDVRWGAGFLLNSSGLFGPSERAFGHGGWGGSFAYGDPERRLGVAYTMNQMGTQLAGDPRNLALIEAIYS